jgi:hypothetical protein
LYSSWCKADKEVLMIKGYWQLTGVPCTIAIICAHYWRFDVVTGLCIQTQLSVPAHHRSYSLTQPTSGSQSGPVPLEGLQVMLSRESARDPPQSFIMTLRDGGSRLSERRVTDYPHPYPQVDRFPCALHLSVFPDRTFQYHDLACQSIQGLALLGLGSYGAFSFPGFQTARTPHATSPPTLLCRPAHSQSLSAQ